MKKMEHHDATMQMIIAAGEYKGLKWYVVSRGTHPCAYVDVTGYDIDEYDVCCHGGVTYAEDSLCNVYDEAFEDFKPGTRRFIGWDYAHLGDRFGSGEHAQMIAGKAWTTDEIVEEAKSVIDEIVGKASK